MDSKIQSLTPYIPPCFLPAVEHLETQAPLLCVALVSVAAVYLGYRFILSRQEAPVSFNVPIPAELRSDWTGKSWDDVQGEERRVLEGQVKGVSRPVGSKVDGSIYNEYYAAHMMENSLLTLIFH